MMNFVIYESINKSDPRKVFKVFTHSSLSGLQNLFDVSRRLPSLYSFMLKHIRGYHFETSHNLQANFMLCCIKYFKYLYYLKLVYEYTVLVLGISKSGSKINDLKSTCFNFFFDIFRFAL